MARGSSAQTTKATLGIRELVFDGELGPAERVPEVALAERLGVSRTPLRIALGTLAHQGLLEPLPGGGFVVRSFTRADIADGIELRGVLEGTAARFAAERLRSADELEQLTEISKQLDEVVTDLSPESLVSYVELNDRFHAIMVELAKSETLERAISNVAALPFAAPSSLLASQALLPRTREVIVVAQHQHRVLIEAIGAGQGTRAEEVTREHARLALRNLDLVLEDHSALAGLEGAPLLRGAV